MCASDVLGHSLGLNAFASLFPSAAPASALPPRFRFLSQPVRHGHDTDQAGGRTGRRAALHQTHRLQGWERVRRQGHLQRRDVSPATSRARV
jgi:hypothetical protein